MLRAAAEGTSPGTSAYSLTSSAAAREDGWDLEELGGSEGIGAGAGVGGIWDGAGADADACDCGLNIIPEDVESSVSEEPGRQKIL